MKRNYYLTAAGLILAALIFSVLVYHRLPQQIPIHWDIHGQADNFGEKPYAAFLGPIIMTAFLILFHFLPWLSPRRFAVDDTARPIYLYIMVLLIGLFGYVHVLALLAALDRSLDIGRAMVGGILLAFALIGNVLGKVPRNFYIGIRTPWTIADERVWYATHRLAARLFVAAGILGFVAVVVAGWMVVGFAVFLAILAVPVLFSLIHYKRLHGQERHPG